MAKALAHRLNYIYVDSGAMYRAATRYLLRKQIDIDDQEAVLTALKEMEIQFKRIDGDQVIHLNGEPVEKEIRKKNVSDKVSRVAAISSVRKKLVEQQRQLGKKKGVVMDGRDIGTVVFPDAELKIFLTADLGHRTERRREQLSGQGVHLSDGEIKRNLQERDHIDSTREDSPLIRATDALLMDNSELTEDEQLEIALKWVKERIVE